MTPFSCSELDRIDDENLCTSSTSQLPNGLVENVLAALYRAIQGKGWFNGWTYRRRMRGAVLCLWMEGDV